MGNNGGGIGALFMERGKKNTASGDIWQNILFLECRLGHECNEEHVSSMTCAGGGGGFRKYQQSEAPQKDARDAAGRALFDGTGG